MWSEQVIKNRIGPALALVLAVGAGDAAAQAAATGATPASTGASDQAARGPGVVVWQGDVELSLDDIDGRMSRIPPDKRAGFINSPERIEQLLRGMLLTKQLAFEAEREGMTADPVVAAEIELAKQEILARRKLSLHMRDLKAPDFTALAKERYLSSPKLYSSQPVLEVRHVLIDSKKHSDAAAKELAHKVHAEITSGQIDFEAAVQKYSDEAKKAEDGGLITDLTPGETLADFDAAAFALKKPGDVSAVVPTRYGYHIIRLEKRTEPHRYPFEDVKAKIEEELRQEYFKRASGEFLDERRNLALDANPDLVQSLRTRYLPGAPGAVAITRMQGDTASAPAPAPAGDAAPDQAPADPQPPQS